MTRNRASDILVPNIGDFDAVEVIEIAVKPGDSVKPEDTLITLESDKATMDIPAPAAGTVREVLVKVGDSVSEGTLILKLEQDGAPDGIFPNADTPDAPDDVRQSPNIGRKRRNIGDGLQVRPPTTSNPSPDQYTDRNPLRRPRPAPRLWGPAHPPGHTPVRGCASLPGNWA